MRFFAATLFWNRVEHLLYKTNPDLSYVFWEHTDSVGRGTTVTLALLHEFAYEFRGNNTYIIQDRTALT